MHQDLLNKILLAFGCVAAVCAVPDSFPILTRQYDNKTSFNFNALSNEQFEENFWKFVTRPDISPPRWNVSVYNQNALQSGYWFTADYENVEQASSETNPWIGPHIYAQDGELIWSGVPLFKGFNMKDFRVSNVAGTPMLTGVYLEEKCEMVVNNRYEVVKKVPVERPAHVNIHGFHTTSDGTRSLAMTQRYGQTSEEESSRVGYDGRCTVIFPGFEERDTSNWEVTFSWNTEGHVGLNESFIDPRCSTRYDYFHGNSIDKFPDGDFLFSGRVTDTMYKISHIDGSIVWRFGGKYSDFSFDDHFSGQHDARVREQNDTHVILSFLDNAFREGHPRVTNDQSRGMIVALETETMTARVLNKYNHPHGELIHGRGNLQLLDNGNVFLSWYLNSLISEHSQDGKLLMEAGWVPPLKSYRAYKFPWIADPQSPPDIHSMAVKRTGTDSVKWTAEDAADVQTVMHVSWNGATEVARWKFFEVDKHNRRTLIADQARNGFETKAVYRGFAQSIVVEALNRKGKTLGESKVFSTLLPDGVDASALVAAQGSAGEGKTFESAASFGGNSRLFSQAIPASVSILGFIVCVQMVLLVIVIRRSRKTEIHDRWLLSLKQGGEGKLRGWVQERQLSSKRDWFGRHGWFGRNGRPGPAYKTMLEDDEQGAPLVPMAQLKVEDEGSDHE